LFVKLSFHSFHPNEYNIFNQVGIIALNFYGEPYLEIDDPIKIDYPSETNKNTYKNVKLNKEIKYKIRLLNV